MALEKYLYTFEQGLQELKGFISANHRFPFNGEFLALNIWINTLRVNKIKGRLSSLQIEELDAINFIWSKQVANKEERSIKVFEKNYEDLVQFIKRYNRYPTKDENPILYFWVPKLRSDKKANKLSTSQINSLDKILFIWNKHENSWEEKISAIYSHLKSGGLLEFAKNTKLNTWYKLQLEHLDRKIIAKHRIEGLNVLRDTIDALKLKESAIPTLHTEKVRESKKKQRVSKNELKFNSNLKLLIAFKTNYHFWPKANAVTPEEKKLGIWCQSLRQRHKKGLLSQSATQSLVEINFMFSRDDTWNNKMTNIEQNLIAYKKPQHYNKAVYTWIRRQFSLIEQLEDDKQKRLLAVKDNFSFFFEEDKWTNQYNNYRDFLSTTKSHPTKITNRKLFEWGKMQKIKFKKGKLNKIQIAKVKGLEINLTKRSSFDVIWDTNFKSLVAFRKKNPERWPSFHSSGSEKKLYQWCQSQRQHKAGTLQKRNDTISQEKIDKLNSIRFHWSLVELLEKNWNYMFDKLQSYILQNNTISIPVKIEGRYNELYRWLFFQKKLKRVNKLDDEKIKKLTSLNVL